MEFASQRLLDELKALVGEDSVVGDAAGMARYLMEPRKRFHQKARAIVLPRDIKNLQTLVIWANKNNVPLVPQGGNTGLVGGQVPAIGTEIVVSLVRMNKILAVDAAAGIMKVEAGVTLGAAHQAAENAGALLPLSIASEGSATIGGVLSTNAGGVGVLAFGNARNLCLGVEAVMANGSIYHGLNALKKDNTGYDLRDLLIGAEGTLGIITAANMKLFPQPESFETAFINVSGPDMALELFYQLSRRAGNTLTAFELMPRFGVEMQLKHKTIARDPAASLSPWYVLAEISRPTHGQHGVLSQSLEDALGADLISDAQIANSLSERENMWKTREQMSESQSREGASIKHDVSVPVAAIPELIARGSAAAITLVPGIRPCPFGHMGDGNIHFNFSQPPGADASAYMEGAEIIHEAIYDIVIDLNGSVSAEHGIGQLKVDLLKKVKDPVALATMRSIKNALDPNNILNPGKLFG